MTSKITVLFPNLEFKDWPKTTNSLCLYCSEKIPNCPLPRVVYYSVKNDLFHISGFFCRPCCVLAHIKETQFGAECDRSYIWTQVFLKRYFNIVDFMCAPPKTALQKYGGTLTLDEFYGNENTFKFKGSIDGPFINSYQIHEFSLHEKKIECVKESDIDEIIRPKIRFDASAEHQETGFPPMLIEYLSQQQEKKIISNKKEEKENKQNSESLFKFMKKS